MDGDENGMDLSSIQDKSEQKKKLKTTGKL